MRPTKARSQTQANALWYELHAYGIVNVTVWDITAAKSWFAAWLARVPRFGCANCKTNFEKFCTANPPDFSSGEMFFRWSVAAHNQVSTEHAQPRKRFIPLMEAEGIYRAPWVVRKPRGMITTPPREEYCLPAIQVLGVEVGREFIPLSAYAQKIGSELILLGDEIKDPNVRCSYAWHFDRLLWVNSDILTETDDPDVFRMWPVADDFASNHYQTFLDLWQTYCFVVEEVEAIGSGYI